MEGLLDDGFLTDEALCFLAVVLGSPGPGGKALGPEHNLPGEGDRFEMSHEEVKSDS